MSKAYVSFENRLFQGFVVPPEIRDEFLQLIQEHNLPPNLPRLRFLVLLLSNGYNRVIMDYLKSIPVEAYQFIFVDEQCFEHQYELLSPIAKYLPSYGKLFTITHGFRYEGMFEYEISVRARHLGDYLRAFLLCDELLQQCPCVKISEYYLWIVSMFSQHNDNRTYGSRLFMFSRILRVSMEDLHTRVNGLLQVYSGFQLPSLDVLKESIQHELDLPFTDDDYYEYLKAHKSSVDVLVYRYAERANRGFNEEYEDRDLFASILEEAKILHLMVEGHGKNSVSPIIHHDERLWSKIIESGFGMYKPIDNPKFPNVDQVYPLPQWRGFYSTDEEDDNDEHPPQLNPVADDRVNLYPFNPFADPNPDRFYYRPVQPNAVEVFVPNPFGEPHAIVYQVGPNPVEPDQDYLDEPNQH